MKALTFEAPGPGTWERDLSHCPPSATLVYPPARLDDDDRGVPRRLRRVGRAARDDGGALRPRQDVPAAGAARRRRPHRSPAAEAGALAGHAAAPGVPSSRAARPSHARRAPVPRRRRRVARRRAPGVGRAQPRRPGRRAGADSTTRALADHLMAVDDHCVQGWIRHHQLHGSDLGPIGDLLAHGTAWGLDPVALLGLLHGASPASCEGRSHGKRIAEALRAAGIDPATVTSLDDVRRDPAAGEALDAYLELFGWRLVTSYDIDGLTTGELPSATCALIRACAVEEADVATPDPTTLREQVPVGRPWTVRRAARRRASGVRHARRQRPAHRGVAGRAAPAGVPGSRPAPRRPRPARRGTARVRTGDGRGRRGAGRRPGAERRRRRRPCRTAAPRGRGGRPEPARSADAATRHVGVPTRAFAG